jgi:hypothetical protein
MMAEYITNTIMLVLVVSWVGSYLMHIAMTGIYYHRELLLHPSPSQAIADLKKKIGHWK